MFREGDKIVHPMHGAGVVESIVEQKVNGVSREYYVLRLPVRSMVVMIPTDNSVEIGVRPLTDSEQADRAQAAAFRKGDPHIGNRSVPVCQLRRCGGAHKSGAGLIR